MRRDSIYNRIDAALEKARWRGLELRGLYLDPDDYAEFAVAETRRWQAETGSKAKMWPLSYENVLILGARCVLVKLGTQSRLFTKTGEGIAVAKRLSAKVAA